MSFLGRALSISKYCQNTILGSVDLRRTLLLESTLGTDFVEAVEPPKGLWVPDFCRLVYERHYPDWEPVQRRQAAVKPYLEPRTVKRPLLITVPRCDRFILDELMPVELMPVIHRLPHGMTHKVLCASIEKAPASALAFQPPLQKVKLYYIYHSTVVSRSTEGITFGVIREELDRQRRESQKMIDDLASRDWTPKKRARFAQAMRHCEINRSPDLAEPCIFFKV